MRELVLAGNAAEDLRALSDLTGLRCLDLRGTVPNELRLLRGMPTFVWVHVGKNGIEASPRSMT